MHEFDTSKLSDQALRRLYDYQKDRGQNIFKSFVSVYKPNQKPPLLDIGYETSFSFQAQAKALAKDHYQVTINHPVIYLLRSFFDVLMGTEPLGSAITNVGAKQCKKVDFNFINDVGKITEIINIGIHEEVERMYVSSTLADFCSTFMMIHEIGHIVCGHVETYQHYFKKNASLQMIGLSEFFRKGHHLKLTMERDADMVAARIAAQYVRSLANKIQNDKRHQNAFMGLLLDESLNDRLIGLVSAILFSFFTYMHGASSRLDFKNSSHPHPFLRTLYIKDAIISTLDEQMIIDIEKVQEYSLEYYDLIDETLTNMSIYNDHTLKSISKMNTEKELKSLSNISSRMRRFTYPHSWLPSSEWE